VMGRLLRAELVRYLYDRTFWIALLVIVLANMVVLTGGHQLEAPGREVLGKIMMKSVATMMIVGVYAGLSFGGDFERGTFSYPIRCGWTMGKALLSKILVFVVFMAFAIILFPICAVAWCTLTNGWGASFTPAEAASFFAMLVSLMVLAASTAMVSVLVSVATRSSAAAIAISLGVTLLQMPVLNGASGLAAAHFLPFGAMWFVAKGDMSPLYGVMLGVVWSIVLYAVCTAILERTDMK